MTSKSHKNCRIDMKFYRKWRSTWKSYKIYYKFIYKIFIKSAVTKYTSYKKWHGTQKKTIKSEVWHSKNYLDPCRALEFYIYHLWDNTLWQSRGNPHGCLDSGLHYAVLTTRWLLSWCLFWYSVWSMKDFCSALQHTWCGTDGWSGICLRNLSSCTLKKSSIWKLCFE